jgi:hypothetical protein
MGYIPRFYLIPLLSHNHSVLTSYKEGDLYKSNRVVKAQRLSGLTIKEFANELQRIIICSDLRNNGVLEDWKTAAKDLEHEVELETSDKMDLYWSAFQQYGTYEEIQIIESYDANTEVVFFDFEKEIKILMVKDEQSTTQVYQFANFYFKSTEGIDMEDIQKFFTEMWDVDRKTSGSWIMNTIIPAACKVVWMNFPEKDTEHLKEKYVTLERLIYMTQVEINAVMGYPIKQIDKNNRYTIFEFNDSLYELFTAFYHYDESSNLFQYNPNPKKVAKILSNAVGDVHEIGKLLFNAGVVAWRQYYPNLGSPEEIITDHMTMAVDFMEKMLESTTKERDEYIDKIEKSFKGFKCIIIDRKFYDLFWAECFESCGVEKVNIEDFDRLRYLASTEELIILKDIFQAMLDGLIIILNKEIKIIQFGWIGRVN